MNLQSIPFKIRSVNEYSIGNPRALLAEIAAGVDKLVRDGLTSSIDLNSLPFAPGEYEQLRLLLGKGEVSAHIDAVGPSEITETRYSGVWWVTHYNIEGDVMAETLEITAVPKILRSQPEDIKNGLVLLRTRLDREAAS